MIGGSFEPQPPLFRHRIFVFDNDQSKSAATAPALRRRRSPIPHRRSRTVARMRPASASARCADLSRGHPDHAQRGNAVVLAEQNVPQRGLHRLME